MDDMCISSRTEIPAPSILQRTNRTECLQRRFPHVGRLRKVLADNGSVMNARLTNRTTRG
jgi:hypothetical protein